MPVNEFLRCRNCRSTFSISSRSAVKYHLPQRCPVCGTDTLEKNSGASGPLADSAALMTCKTCKHAYPITGPQSLEKCPSCGGDPMAQGDLVLKGESLVWVSRAEAPDKDWGSNWREVHEKIRCVHPPGCVQCNWCGYRAEPEPTALSDMLQFSTGRKIGPEE